MSKRSNRVKRRSLNNVISHRQCRCMRMRERNKSNVYRSPAPGYHETLVRMS